MRAAVTTDPVAYRRLVFDFLTTDPVLNTVIIAQVENRVAGQAAGEDPGQFVSVHDDEDTVIGAATRLNGRGAFIGDLRPELAPPVAEALAKAAPQTTQVEGEPVAARAFAGHWKALLGKDHRQTVAKRLHRLGTLVPHTAPGGPRLAVLSDHDLISRWHDAFNVDVNEPPRDWGPDVLHQIDDRRYWLWLDDGRPVSLVGHARPAAGVARVGPVYTPDGRRGRGYASALTAYVSRLLLDQGHQVCLYTDLSNPTSNKIYAAIGYEPVCDIVDYTFG
jgi:predicted GNAT family acetyltransferase